MFRERNGIVKKEQETFEEREREREKWERRESVCDEERRNDMQVRKRQGKKIIIVLGQQVVEDVEGRPSMTHPQ